MFKFIAVCSYAIAWTLLYPLEIIAHYFKGLIGGILDILED